MNQLSVAWFSWMIISNNKHWYWNSLLFAIIRSFILLWRLSARCWSVTEGICDRSATGTLVSSGTSVGVLRRLQLLFIPEVFSWVDVRALSRTLEILHSSHVFMEVALCTGAWIWVSVPVKGNCSVCFQHGGKNLGTTEIRVRCSCTFGHVVQNVCVYVLIVPPVDENADQHQQTYCSKRRHHS